MARCLITVWPVPGHYNPCLAIAHALRRDGHEVAFYTGGRVQALIEREGFAVYPFRRVKQDEIDAVLFDRQELPPWRRLLAERRRLRAWLVDTLADQVADISDVVDRWHPDVVVCDISMWAPFVVLAESRGLRVAIYQFQLGCLLPGRDAPPAGFGLAPTTHWKGRLAAAAVGPLLGCATRDLRRGVDEVRRQHGLAPLTTTPTAHAGTMPLYLVTSAAGLDYERHDLPPSVHYVGACLWDRPRTEAPPEWLSELGGGQPVVHVTEGTIHMRRPLLLSAAAAGLAGLPMQVVMTTGSQRQPSELGLGSLASNIRLASWVPHSLLLPKTDVVVTTGGAGTVLASLMAGVPLLMVPTEWDKPDGARRIVEAGAGLSVPPHRCTPRRVREAVERLLGDASFRRNAARLRDLLTATGGVAEAARLIGALAEDRSDGRGHRIVDARRHATAPQLAS
jgi:UDP:flavonoid glycosyltransferase YjiC (YdhE family)